MFNRLAAMIYFAVAATFCLMFSPPALAQQAATSFDMQAALVDGITEVHSDLGVVALAGLVMQDGEVIAEFAVGERRLGNGTQVTLSDEWHLGSVTKSMTATLAARMVEQGLVEWDTPVTDMLPDTITGVHESWQNITLVQLLSHSSGLRSNISPGFSGWDERELDALHSYTLDRIAGLVDNEVMPGSFRYSNAGYIMAGTLLAELAGEPYETLMQREVFEPLGLTSAAFGPPQGQKANWGHQVMFGIRFAKDPTGRADNPPYLSPAGRARMTLRDLATYGRLHATQGTNQPGFLTVESFETLHTPQLNNYALGWSILSGSDDRPDILFHNGTNTYWYAMLVPVPDHDLVFVFASNDGAFRQIENAIIPLLKTLTAQQIDSRND